MGDDGERVADNAELEIPSDFESILPDYPVKLEKFEGPLDLLLFLINRNEIDIYDIPIVTITAQYLEYLELMQELDLDVAGEFLLMAATLIHIKSRMLVPRIESESEGEVDQEDPRDALVRRLLEHQQFKAAAELLYERETLRSAQWTRPDGRVEEVAGEPFERELEIDLFGLLQAFQAVLMRARERPPVQLPEERMSIETRIKQLLGRLSETEACRFEELFADAASRQDLVTTFLAVLEMVLVRAIRVFQSGAFRPIRIYRRARIPNASKSVKAER